MEPIPIHFRWSDCDAAGVAYYPRIIERLHEALEIWFEKGGVPFAQCIGRGLGLPTVSLKTDFRIPCRMGDACCAEVTPVRVSTSSMELRLVLRGADGAERVRAEQVLVAIDRTTGRPCPVPEDIRRLF